MSRFAHIDAICTYSLPEFLSKQGYDSASNGRETDVLVDDGEGHFGKSPCEVCGDHTHGNRYGAQGLVREESRLVPGDRHLVCVDCVYAIEYGGPTTESNPGKFEGEPAYTQHYWNQALNGTSDDDRYIYLEGNDSDDADLALSCFKVDAAEARAYPELEIGDWVIVWEDSQGFVMSRHFHTASAITHWITQYLGTSQWTG